MVIRVLMFCLLPHMPPKMLRAISYCHARGVCHRDIKLENFLYETKSPAAKLKMIDFGLSKQQQQNLLKSPTPGAPPRVQRMRTQAGTRLRHAVCLS